MEKSLKILLLEDSLDDAILIEREIEKAGIVFTSLVVNKRIEFENALKEFKPDVILSDHSLPQFNSIEAFKIFKEHQKDSDLLVPFILVTGHVSEEFAVQSLKSGVDDYILKDRLKRLPVSIKHVLEKCRLERERLNYLAQIIAKEALMNEAEQLAHFGSWQADMTTGKTIWSDESYFMYGYEPGEVQPNYELFLSAIHPDDFQRVKEAQDHAVQHLDSIENEFRIIDYKGKLKHLGCRLEIYRDAAGRPIRLVGFNLDITDRKQAQIALQKSEQEYKSLFDQNPDAVFSLDLQGRFTNVNKGLADLTGLSASEMRGMDFLDFVHPDDLQGARKIVVNDMIIGVHGVAKDITEKKEWENLIDQAYRLASIGGWEMYLSEQKIKWTSVTRELHEVGPGYEPDLETAIQFYKEGNSRETIRKAIEDAINSGKAWDLELQIITAKGNERWARVMGEAEMKNGRCVRLYGTLQDIHERKKAEETVRESYEEKISILESIGDAFFAVDRKGTVTYWNNIAENVMGMAREKILGKNLWEVYGDAVSLKFHTEYEKAMKGNVAVHFEEFYPPLNLWLEVSIYPSASGLSIYFRDITGQKKTIREITNQNETLMEIAWIQSHEVRAPLARMMGLINLINDRLERETELPELLARIQSSAVELDGIIKKIVRKTEAMEKK